MGINQRHIKFTAGEPDGGGGVDDAAIQPTDAPPEDPSAGDIAFTDEDTAATQAAEMTKLREENAAQKLELAERKGAAAERDKQGYPPPAPSRPRDPLAGQKASVNKLATAVTTAQAEYKKLRAADDDTQAIYAAQDAYDAAREKHNEAKLELVRAEGRAASQGSEANAAVSAINEAMSGYEQYEGYKGLPADDKKLAKDAVGIVMGALMMSGQTKAGAQQTFDEICALADKGMFSRKKAPKKAAPDIATASAHKRVVPGKPPTTFEEVTELNKKIHPQK